ncbi:MAG: hypothetical protein PHY47_11350 [Lachnospiraceae bacterium]|nr:hypothetical protein [Lachnospiraceae bacterium]
MSNTAWMDDVTLKKIPKEKLLFLQSAVFDTQNLSQKEMMPFIMAMATKARKQKIHFSNEETNLIIEAIKKNSTNEDLVRMNQVLSLAKMF